MPALDSTAKAAVNGHFAAAWFIWLDVTGDVIRVTTFGANVTFASTGDSDLDGNTFTAFGGPLIEVGDVTNSDSGSDTLDVTLSGILEIDSTLLNAMGDVTKWQGRTARIWLQLYDATGVTKQGGIIPYYTGYMSKLSILAKPSDDQTATPASQVIQLSIENYLSFTTQASNRSYLNQSDYDAADSSASASIAASNGLRSASGSGGAVNNYAPPQNSALQYRRSTLGIGL